jgi:hypothetical protein
MRDSMEQFQSSTSKENTMTIMKKLTAVLLSAISLIGCATNYDTGTGIHPTGNAAAASIQQVKLGMTKTQVIALIGRPLRVNEAVTLEGNTQKWAYTGEQFWTFGQAVAIAAATGAAGYVGTPNSGLMILTFSGDHLTSIEKGT